MIPLLQKQVQNVLQYRVKMTIEESPEDKIWRSTEAEGRQLLVEARRRLEANRLEIGTLRTLLSKAQARFEELQQLVAELDQTFGRDH